MSGLQRATVVRGEFTRGQFIGMGLSAALLYSAVSPFAAKAKTVRFGMATTGRLSDYCRGDGRDETAEINRCFADHLFVEVDEPPAGIGYGFHANGPGGGIVLRSGHEVNGRGAASKFLRVGAWERNCKGLINENQPDGDSSIKLNNLYIKGFRDRPDVPNIDSNSDATGIAIRAANADSWCRDISLTGVEVHNWPGVAMRFNSGWGVHLTDVKSMNPARGGVQFRTSRDMSLLRVTSGDSGDDAIAFNTDSHFGSGAISGITMDRCVSYTRKDPQWGAGLKFGGATDALVTNSTFSYAKNALVTIGTFPGFDPRNIRVNNCRMLGGEQHSFEVRANHAAGISARGNYMHNPKASCVAVSTMDRKPATFDVTVTDNTLSSPGSTHHITVQENLKGVHTSGNHLIYEYTTAPRLRLESPKPGSRVSSPVKKLQAYARASVSNSKNDLRKGNVKLFINNHRANFDYYKSGAVVRNKPRLRRGKNKVRLEVSFVGKTTQKSWSFTAR